MPIRIGTLVSSGNREDGVRIEGDVDVEIGNANIFDNGGQGINMVSSSNILKQFGLPEDTDPKEFGKLLVEIQNAPEEEKKNVIKGSSLIGKFFRGAINTSTLISNLVNISTTPQMAAIIATLMAET